MVNRELKLPIGDELQTLFHPIVNATKQTAEEARKELAQMKKKLTDIDGALTAQRATDAKPQPGNTDATFGLLQRQNGLLGMGNKVARLSVDAKALIVDDIKYKLTAFLELITNKHPRAGQWKTNDYQVYKSLVAQTKVKPFPIGQVLLDHTLRGNGSIWLGKWLYLGKV